MLEQILLLLKSWTTQQHKAAPKGKKDKDRDGQAKLLKQHLPVPQIH